MDSQLDVGGVLQLTFRVLFANIVPYMLLTALALAPMIGVQAMTLSPPSLDVLVLAGIVSWALTLVLQQAAVGAITYGVFQQLRGRRAPFGDCVLTGLRRALPVLGVAIVTGLATLAGMLLCIVPGVIIWVMLSVAVPSAVVERVGVRGALQRSLDLTRGHRWPIFGVFFLLILLNLALGAAVEVALAGKGAVYLTVWSVVSVFSGALMAIAGALVYYRLRLIKEQFDVDEVAAIFA